MATNGISTLAPERVTGEEGTVQVARVVSLVRAGLLGGLAVLGAVLVAAVIASVMLAVGSVQLAGPFLALAGAALVGTAAFAVGDVLTE
jgi:hypothetical protein